MIATVAAAGVLTVAASLMQGCSSEPQRYQHTMIPATVSGTAIPEGDMDRIRYGEGMKKYNTGRFVDPNNSNYMYPAGIMYSVEESPGWNLKPNADIGPFKPTNPRKALLADEKSLVTDLEAQLGNFKEYSRVAKENNREIGKAVEGVKSNLEALRKAGERDKTRDVKVQELEKKFEQIHKEVKEAEKRASEAVEKADAKAAQVEDPLYRKGNATTDPALDAELRAKGGVRLPPEPMAKPHK